MANPSTTGPSGIGSEVLRRRAITGASDTTSTLITVGTDMIVTVLTVVITNNHATTGKTFGMQINIDGSSSVQLLSTVALNQYDSYIWNDRLVMTETDVLQVSFNSLDHDILVSYIEQEFA